MLGDESEFEFWTMRVGEGFLRQMYMLVKHELTKWMHKLNECINCPGVPYKPLKMSIK